jgi:hypothetical protein
MFCFCAPEQHQLALPLCVCFNILTYLLLLLLQNIDVLPLLQLPSAPGLHQLAHPLCVCGVLLTNLLLSNVALLLLQLPSAPGLHQLAHLLPAGGERRI